MSKYNIKETIMRRDDLSEDEVDSLIEDAKADVAAGIDPEEVLLDYFGLEPDYIWDLLT